MLEVSKTIDHTTIDITITYQADGAKFKLDNDKQVLLK